MAACAEPADDELADAIDYEDATGDETSLLADMPGVLRGDMPVDLQSAAPFEATIVIDASAMPDVGLPSVFPASSLLPVYCSAEVADGALGPSSCYLAVPTAPSWIELSGGITVADGQALDVGQVVCMAFFGDEQVSDSTCRHLSYEGN